MRGQVIKWILINSIYKKEIYLRDQFIRFVWNIIIFLLCVHPGTVCFSTISALCITERKKNDIWIIEQCWRAANRCNEFNFPVHKYDFCPRSSAQAESIYGRKSKHFWAQETASSSPPASMSGKLTAICRDNFRDKLARMMMTLSVGE